ncbi:MAG: hypothetical protein ABFS56_15495 [Pseudomonadota bacterium]
MPNYWNGDSLRTLFDGKPVLPLKIEKQQYELLNYNKKEDHTTTLLQYLDDLYVANGAEKSQLRQQIKAQLTAMVEAHWANKEETLNKNLQNIDKRRVKGQISSQKLAKDYETCLHLLADITEQRTRLNKSRQAGEELDLPFTPLHLKIYL